MAAWGFPEELPPDLDRYGRGVSGFENGPPSGVCDLRKGGYSDDGCLLGPDGGDMEGGSEGGGGGPVLAAGIDVAGGREYIEPDVLSRSGRSASEPSIDDIDMLLPGLCAGFVTASSREAKDGGIDDG